MDFWPILQPVTRGRLWLFGNMQPSLIGWHLYNYLLYCSLIIQYFLLNKVKGVYWCENLINMKQHCHGLFQIIFFYPRTSKRALKKKHQSPSRPFNFFPPVQKNSNFRSSGSCKWIYCKNANNVSQLSRILPTACAFFNLKRCAGVIS